MTKPIKVKMFTKKVCPTCKIAKQQLSFLPVPVEIKEVNIEENTMYAYSPKKDDFITAQEYLTEVLDSMSTPTFEFESGRIVRGFEMGEILDELNL